MSKSTSPRLGRLVGKIRSRPVLSYFGLTFLVSWTGALILLAPELSRGDSISKLTGLLIFPTMLLGPAVGGFAMTAVMAGKHGIKDLLSRMRRVRFPRGWFLPLLVAPLLVFGLLELLSHTVSNAFAPNHFVVGIVFGIFAGFWEEIGWTGFAFPSMAADENPFRAALVLGLLWSAWHIPAIDYLGTATPHGACWLPFFLAFTAGMTAMRILICWSYVNTGSVLLAQLMHASSTAALVVLSPPAVTSAQEAAWYAAYAAVLWIVVLVMIRVYGTRLSRRVR
jgi:CAAX protease family protein